MCWLLIVLVFYLRLEHLQVILIVELIVFFLNHFMLGQVYRNIIYQLLLFVKICILVKDIVLILNDIRRFPTIHARWLSVFLIDLTQLNTKIEYLLIKLQFLCISKLIKLHRWKYLLKNVISHLSNNLLLQLLASFSLLPKLLLQNFSFKLNDLFQKNQVVLLFS